MKDPIFTKEAVMKVLAGQEEDGQKVDALFALYNEDLNGLKMNRDDLKAEKEKVEGKLADALAENAKIAEDFAGLQKQLESSSPEKDTTIKELTEKYEKSQKTEHYLKCIQDFNKAAEGYDIEPSGRDFLFEAIYGQDGSKFIERDLGEGMKLYNTDGQTGVAAAKAFFNTDLGKKFIRNISSGGGAGTGTGGAGAAPIVNPFKKETLNLGEQARLLKEDPEQYKLLKAAAGA